MNKKNDRKILITCPKVGFIPHLGMQGPIPNPLRVDYTTCVNMIIAGVSLYEVDPATRNTVLLTLDNIDDENKFGTKVAPSIAKVDLKEVGKVAQPKVDVDAVKKAEEERLAKEAAEKEAKEAAEKAEKERLEKEKEARREAAKQQAEKYRNEKREQNANTNSEETSAE